MAIREIREEFDVHLLNDAGIEAAKALAEIFSECLNKVLAITGSASREVSLVKTKMQEASFWAKRSVAVNPNCQKLPTSV